MKLLSVAIPCYNSQDYMEHAIHSVIAAGDRVECIIVDDGSKDNTLKIAKKYERRFPDIVKVVHQENGGHGQAVNAGIREASGLYFKVLDSDDMLGKQALFEVLELLSDFTGDDAIDMLITNFLYNKEGARHRKVMRYKKCLPEGRVFGWEDVKLGQTKYILMHSVIYRTELLRECGLELPKHTFYVDNIYVFKPLPYVKKMYYLDVTLYSYYIGREDQSVNESVMISRLDQQYKVNRIMLDDYCSMDIKDENCKKAMFHYFNMITCISSILSIREGSQKRLDDKAALLAEIKEKDESLYRSVRKSILGITMNLPGKVGRGISVFAYKVTDKIFGFN